MAHEAFSAAWNEEFQEQINRSDAYKSAAQSWDAPMILRLTMDSGETTGVYLDLYHGECREARTIEKGVDPSATYVLSADSEIWQSILQGDIDVLSALMSGKIVLERGSVSALASYVLAAHELVECAKRIETVFPE